LVQLFGILIHGLKFTKKSKKMKEVTPLIIISLNKGASIDMIAHPVHGSVLMVSGLFPTQTKIIMMVRRGRDLDGFVTA